MANWLIVGADKGIGASMCMALAARGEHVYAACLADGAQVAGKSVTVIPKVDVTSDASVESLCDAIAKGHAKIDVLVNVAGVLGLDELGKIDFGDVRRQIEINTIGPLRVVQAMLPHLASRAKVGIITSRVVARRQQQRRHVRLSRIQVRSEHGGAEPAPRSLQTRNCGFGAPSRYGRNRPDRDYPGSFNYIQPEEAAAGLINALDALTLETSGRFQHSNGEYLPWSVWTERATQDASQKEEAKMVTKLYQYVPGWTVACISPYVSKVANSFRMTGHPFELVQQDLSRLATDVPRAKLPYIVEPDGDKIPTPTRLSLTPRPPMAIRGKRTCPARTTRL